MIQFTRKWIKIQFHEKPIIIIINIISPVRHARSHFNVYNTRETQSVRNYNKTANPEIEKMQIQNTQNYYANNTNKVIKIVQNFV